MMWLAYSVPIDNLASMNIKDYLHVKFTYAIWHPKLVQNKNGLIIDRYSDG